MILHSSTASDTPMQCLSVSNGRNLAFASSESMHVYLLFYSTAVLAAFAPDSHFDVENLHASDTPMQCLSVSNGRNWRLSLQESMQVYLLFLFYGSVSCFLS